MPQYCHKHRQTAAIPSDLRRGLACVPVRLSVLNIEGGRTSTASRISYMLPSSSRLRLRDARGQVKTGRGWLVQGVFIAELAHIQER